MWIKELKLKLKNKKIANRLFSCHAPVPWNSLPADMRQLNKGDTHYFSHYPLLTLSHSQFQARLKTFLIQKYFPSQSFSSSRFSDHRTWLTDSSHHHIIVYLSLVLISFTNVFWFMAQLLQCLRVSRHFMMHLYRHFESSLSWLKSAIISFH